MATDFYPKSMDAKVGWHANFAVAIVALASKYGILSATLTQINHDNDWIGNWVSFRNTFNASSQALTKYFNTIAGNDSSVAAPAPFSIDIPGAVIITEVPPGIEKRVRDIAAQIKGHAAYNPADGEALGIVAPASELPSGPETMKPVLELSTLVEFGVGVKFRKFGRDGIRLEYRHHGSAEWISAGFLVTSPGQITVAPAVPGTPEQVEVRAIFLDGNTPVGDYSEIGAVFVKP